MRSPLCEVGLTKEEIRLLSLNLELPTWDKPSLACLSSRIPYGTPITMDILQRIKRAEEFLLSFGLRQVRVRHHGEVARIEIELEHMEKVIRRREEVVAELKILGYSYITLDLEGYRSGSLNEVLKSPKENGIDVARKDGKVKMTRMIKVRTWGEKTIKQVSLQEAEQILEEIYNDSIGGLVADARTGKVILQIGPEVEEIMVFEQMLGGG